MSSTPTNKARLCISLGSTLPEQLAQAQCIKDAMVNAILDRIGSDLADSDDEFIKVYQSIYLEADYRLNELKNQ